VKRLIDIVMASLALVVLAPALAVIACLVRLSGPGPIIYRGWRVGRDDRPFRILKFRTMVSNADEGSQITVNRDPRVTAIGRLLRASKLDELPQVINVLRGEMSLVGPRPEAPHYVAHYTPQQRAVLSVRPGITGPSQVLFRHEEQILCGPDPETHYLSVVMPAKLATDLDYVQNHSFGRDLQIIAHTLSVLVWPRRGATTTASPRTVPAGHQGAVGRSRPRGT
jgi:lipopolysaccharide/colanic/teichoic acid biosynthesis glycosyltransferase